MSQLVFQKFTGADFKNAVGFSIAGPVLPLFGISSEASGFLILSCGFVVLWFYLKSSSF